MAQLPKHLLDLSKGDLESMCVDCGLCCHASVKLEKGGSVLVPELRCKHLEVEKSTGRSCCSVYEQRHDVAKGWCLPLAEAIDKGVFPELCPYVKGMKNYVGAAILSDQAYEYVKPALIKAITDGGKPSWVADSQWDAFVGLSKAHGHKYIKREGSPGNYKYTYPDDEEKKPRRKNEKRVDVWSGSPSPEMVEQWRSDMRRMSKIYRSIKPPAPLASEEEKERFASQFEEARGLFRRFTDSMQSWAQDRVLAEDENEVTQKVFRAAFHDVRNARSEMFPTRFDHETFKQVGPNEEEFRRNREKALKRYQRKIKESLDEVDRYIADQSLEKLERKPAQQTFEKHGVNFVIYGKGMNEEYEQSVASAIRQFDDVNTRFKELGIEKALEGLTVHVHSTTAGNAGFRLKGGDLIAGAYQPNEDKLRLFWLGHERSTLVHEIGHRVYFKRMTNQGRASWHDAITKNKVEVKPEHIDQFISQHVEGNSYEVEGAGTFIDVTKIKDSVAQTTDTGQKAVFEKFLGDLPHTSPDEVRAYLYGTIEEGTLVDREFVTDYAKTNPEEMFAEAFMKYVEEGPGAVPEWTRTQLREAMRAGGVAFKKSLLAELFGAVAE